MICRILKITKNCMQKSKVNLAAKIFFGLSVGILLGAIIALIVSNFSPDFANWWWLHVVRVVDGAMYLAFQYISINYFVLMTILAVLGLLTVFIPKIGRSFAVATVGVVAVAAFVPLINYYQESTTSKLNSLYFSGREEASYSADDLYDLALYFRNRTKKLSKGALLAELGDDKDDVINVAVANLRNAADKFDFLQGGIVRKLEIGEFDYTGMTFPYRVTASEGYSNGELLNTVTHELCHMKGLLREDEATFCAIMAGIWSGDSLAQYVGYAEALRMSAIALTMMDYDARKIDDLFGPFQGECRANSANCANIYLNVDDLDEYVVNDWEEWGGYVDQLAPFPSGSDLSEMMANRAHFDGEYYYSRAARLLLEYFDVNGRE